MILGHFFFEDPLGVLFGLPGVNGEWLAQADGKAELADEYVSLHLAGRVVVVVI